MRSLSAHTYGVRAVLVANQSFTNICAHQPDRSRLRVATRIHALNRARRETRWRSAAVGSTSAVVRRCTRRRRPASVEELAVLRVDDDVVLDVAPDVLHARSQAEEEREVAPPRGGEKHISLGCGRECAVAGGSDAAR